MRILLTARERSGLSGGVEQVVAGLAHGLSSLADGDEKFYFWSILGDDEWLRNFVGGPCEILPTPEDDADSVLRSLVRAVPFSAAISRSLPPIRGLRRRRPGYSDGTPERVGADLVHFTTQWGFLTDLPSVYQPHDLLHVHLPKLLSARECEFRETSYRLHCERARFVVAMTSWGKNDLVQHLGLPPEKVRVIPWAPAPFTLTRVGEEDLDRVDRKFSLPSRFILYPAQTWPHKNHLILLEALSILRNKRKLVVPLVCCGTRNGHFPRIEARASKLGLNDQVRFLDFISAPDLRSLYKRANALVFPTLFEGWGMPICEAFSAGLPVACSRVTSLPDLVNDAACLFEPNDPEDVARAIELLWENDDLRDTLIRRGTQRVAQFNWKRTAERIRVLYRLAGNEALTPEDEVLLNEPILV
jgi:glycosyltransferase involved in cell wall biosynthesis